MVENKTFLIINATPNTDDLASFQSYISQIIGIFTKFDGNGMLR